jgi:hypothetical protein
MGEDARLQNELFKYPLDWNSVRLYQDQESTDEGASELFDQYITSVDSLLKAQFAYIDELCQANPTLSTRFNRYRKGNTLAQQACSFGQARFRAPQFQFPDNARHYAYDTFWTKLEEPYTLHRDVSSFLRDYVDDATQRHETLSFSILDFIDEIASNEEERTLLHRWKDWIAEAQPLIDAVSTLEEKRQVAEKLNADNADLIKAAEKILNGEKGNKFVNDKLLVLRMKAQIEALDSLQASAFIKDMELTRIDNGDIEHRR